MKTTESTEPGRVKFPLYRVICATTGRDTLTTLVRHRAESYAHRTSGAIETLSIKLTPAQHAHAMQQAYEQNEKMERFLAAPDPRPAVRYARCIDRAQDLWSIGYYKPAAPDAVSTKSIPFLALCVAVRPPAEAKAGVWISESEHIGFTATRQPMLDRGTLLHPF